MYPVAFGKVIHSEALKMTGSHPTHSASLFSISIFFIIQIAVFLDDIKWNFINTFD